MVVRDVNFKTTFSVIANVLLIQHACMCVDIYKFKYHRGLLESYTLVSLCTKRQLERICVPLQITFINITLEKCVLNS